MGDVERILLRFGRVMRRPTDVEPGFTAGFLLEEDGRQRFPRPGRHDGMTCDLAGVAKSTPPALVISRPAVADAGA
jgi:hypothetical protein